MPAVAGAGWVHQVIVGGPASQMKLMLMGHIKQVRVARQL